MYIHNVALLDGSGVLHLFCPCKCMKFTTEIDASELYGLALLLIASPCDEV